jgi:predicted nucleic acid-binding protein
LVRHHPTAHFLNSFICDWLSRADRARAGEVGAGKQRGRAVDLTRATALAAARLSLNHGIAMADSIMLATAQRNDEILWTQDADFDALPGTRYFAKQ